VKSSYSFCDAMSNWSRPARPMYSVPSIQPGLRHTDGWRFMQAKASDASRHETSSHTRE